MATNKNASYRYRVIDNCLKNRGRKWTLNDLINTISEKLWEDFGIQKGISKRTVQNDISIMRSLPPRGFDAPIVCKEGFYYYEDPEFSINNSPLNEQDLESLQDAIALLKQFESVPVFEELKAMVVKLEGKMLRENQNSRKIIDIEKVENTKGLHHVKPLYHFIKEKKVIEVTYHPFTKDENLIMILHPYLIKEFNNRWFLIGFNDEYKNMSHLALDRIESVLETNKTFEKVKSFNHNNYFDNVIGITIRDNSKPETILLRFTKSRAPYVKTKPIHKSQKIVKEDEDGIVIQLKLIVNQELTSLLLSFGEDLEVLNPIGLRNQIIEILSKAQKNYK